jgi:DHA1 family bicyclomycin/chloramphenicol resistance-like MFS transporter
MKNFIYLVFLIAMGVFPPLSTDMYLPALPTIAKDFGAGVNITMIAFFLPFAVATLLWGPLSDKYGRKPILTIGMICYTLGSVFCALSFSVTSMVLARVLQGIGGGSGNAVCFAIVRDLYIGRKQERILAIMQSMFMIAPVVAPLIGSILMNWFSWRGVFYAQALTSILVLLGAIVMKETIKERNDIGVFHSLSRLWIVLKYRKFAYLTVICSLPQLPLMCYVVASSFIYQDFFKLDSITYSLMFALAAFGTMAGPITYSLTRNILSRETFINLYFAFMIAGGVIVCLFGHSNPLGYAIMMFFMGMFSNGTKVPTAYLILNYKKGDIGSASSLMGSAGFFAGCIGMAVSGIPFDSINVTGFAYTITSVIALVMFVAIMVKSRDELPK